MGGDYNPKQATEEDAGYDIMSLAGGTRIVSKEEIALSHEMCNKHLALPAFAGERRVRGALVSDLLNHMRRGTFRPELVALATCRCKEEVQTIEGETLKAGTTWRINGQHTCWARLQLPASFKLNVIVIRYVAETAYDMRMLYASFDRGGGRTRQHVIKSYLAGLPAFADFSVKALERAPSGFAHWQWGTAHGGSGRGHDGDEVAYLMQTQWLQLSSRVMGFLTTHGTSDNDFILRCGVTAAMFATFDKAPSDAARFWEPVATGIGIAKAGDPRLKLRTALVGSSVDGRTTEKRSADREDMYRWCITTWNAWREGRTLNVLRTSDKRQLPK